MNGQQDKSVDGPTRQASSNRPLGVAVPPASSDGPNQAAGKATSAANTLAGIDFAKGEGLVPIVVQDDQTRQVLMVGYANQEAVERTLATGRLHLWSRSRNELWLKGERSGNYLQVCRLSLDCDGDALLAEVRPATGETPICHTGAETCFFEPL